MTVTTSSKSANMYEWSFMNQICTNIVIISRVELPNKIARNHHGRKEGGSVGWKKWKAKYSSPLLTNTASLLPWEVCAPLPVDVKVHILCEPSFQYCVHKCCLPDNMPKKMNPSAYHKRKSWWPRIWKFKAPNMSNCQYPTWLLIKFAKVWHPRMWTFSCLLSRSSVRTFTRLMAKYALHQQAHSSMHKNWAIENSWEAISIAINGILVLAKNFANSHLLFTNEE